MTTTWKAIDKEIGLIGTAGETFNKRVHAAAVSILTVWIKSPSLGQEAAYRLTTLQNAAGPMHAKKFGDWVKVAGLNWSSVTETYYTHKGQKLSKAAFDALKAVPYYEMKAPKKAREAINIESLVKAADAIIKKIQTAAKDPVEGDAITPAMANAVLDMSHTLRQLQLDIEVAGKLADAA